MATSYKQDTDFAEAVLPNTRSMLELAIDWIRNNMNPEDVFSQSDLERWAEGEGYAKEAEENT